MSEQLTGDWPACRVCGQPVEITPDIGLRRTRVELRTRELLGGSYRLPDDVHLGDCLRTWSVRSSRESIARSEIPEVP